FLPKFITTRRPGVIQVESEWNPPNEIVRCAQDHGRNRPLTAPDKIQPANRAKYLAQKPNRRQEPASLGNSGDLQIKDAVQADDHSQAGKDFRVVLQGHPCEAEQPLGIEDREGAPPQVVKARDKEHHLMKLPPGNHDRSSSASAPQGHPPYGMPSAA